MPAYTYDDKWGLVWTSGISDLAEVQVRVLLETLCEVLLRFVLCVSLASSVRGALSVRPTVSRLRSWPLPRCPFGAPAWPSLTKRGRRYRPRHQLFTLRRYAIGVSGFSSPAGGTEASAGYRQSRSFTTTNRVRSRIFLEVVWPGFFI